MAKRLKTGFTRKMNHKTTFMCQILQEVLKMNSMLKKLINIVKYAKQKSDRDSKKINTFAN